MKYMWKKIFVMAFVLSMFLSSGNVVYAEEFENRSDMTIKYLENEANSRYDDQLFDEMFLNSTFDGMSVKDGMYQFKFITDYMSKEMKTTAKAKEKEFLSRTSVAIDSLEPMAKTTIVLATEDVQQAQELMRRIAGDSTSVNKFDATRGVRATLTVYYVEGSFPTGQDSLLVTGIEGSVRIDDKNISVLINDDNFVAIGCNDGFIETRGQYYDYYVKKIPFSESTPSNWTPIDVSQKFVGGAGATWQIPLRRAGTYWDLVVENVLYGELTIY